MKAACGEGRGTQEIICGAWPSANPDESSAPRHRPTEHPGPLFPAAELGFPARGASC